MSKCLLFAQECQHITDSRLQKLVVKNFSDLEALFGSLIDTLSEIREVKDIFLNGIFHIAWSLNTRIFEMLYVKFTLRRVLIVPFPQNSKFAETSSQRFHQRFVKFRSDSSVFRR